MQRSGGSVPIAESESYSAPRVGLAMVVRSAILLSSLLIVRLLTGLTGTDSILRQPSGTNWRALNSEGAVGSQMTRDGVPAASEEPPPKTRSAGGPVVGRTRSVWRTVRDMALIIVSILIAFALDRWWDAARENAQERRYLHALQQEFSSNKAALEQFLSRLATLDTAIAQILSLTGPEPQLVSADSVAALFDASFRFGVLDLPSGSIQALLASGDLAMISNAQVKASVAAWPARVAAARNDTELLQQNREDILRHLDTMMPTRAVASNISWWSYGNTKFPIAVAPVLSNVRLEGLLANRAVRLRNVRNGYRRLTATADTVINLIDTQLGVRR